MSEKKLVTKTIFRKVSTTEGPFTWKDIKHIDFQDDDVINAGFEDAYYGSDSSMDAHHYITVTRKILETDAEYEKRVERDKREKEEMKKRRYENYLHLKKEFEDGEADKM